MDPAVSIIVPCHNAAPFLHDCLLSILHQRDIDLRSSVQLILVDDCSTDTSVTVARSLQPRLSSSLHTFSLLSTPSQLGCGGARNLAVRHALAPILAFQDADDVMAPDRLSRTLTALSTHSDYDIIGGVFDRIPNGSTERYTKYHATLTTAHLISHAFRDAPLPMPTVACRIAVCNAVPFVPGIAVPEDLHFLYGAMYRGFKLFKLLGQPLVTYRFHDAMMSKRISRRDMLRVRVAAFEQLVLRERQGWQEGFSIWGAGRDGKQVYEALTQRSQTQLICWGDVDHKKIGTVLKNKPVVHFSKLTPPVVCCVALDRDGAQFERNLQTLQLTPGSQYVHLI